MIRNWRNTAAVACVLMFGFILFFAGTDGFQAFTAETARVNQLIDKKPSFPDVTIEDSSERVYPVSQFQGKYVLTTFIYTSCGTVCPQMEMNMAEVYDMIPSKYIGVDIQFLSLSFDPVRDDPATLNRYKDYFNSDGETWRMARVKDQAELDALLKAFGVIVIPDDYGNFTHNAAFYLVDREGRLIDVMDYTKIEEAAQKIIGILEDEGRSR